MSLPLHHAVYSRTYPPHVWYRSYIYFNVTLYNLYYLTTHMFDIIITLGILLWKGMLKMQPYYVHFLYIYIKHSLNTLCNA
jgi:hypothetical protein